MLALFRNRSYACFWGAGLVTVAGDAALDVGLPIYVFLLTHSVLATGALFMAKGLIAFLISPIVGVLVDRWNRKRILVVSNALLAVVVLLLLLVRTPSLVWIVYVSTGLVTLIAAFVPVAAVSMVPAIVAPEQLSSSSSLGNIGGYIARMTGPALGGWLVTKHGLVGLVVFDSATFVFAAVLTGFVEVPQRDTDARTGFREAWLDGLRTMFDVRLLRLLVLGLAIVTVGESVFTMLWPLFVTLVLHGGAEQSGFLLTANAVGGLIGGAAVALLGHRVVSGRVIGIACLVYAALLCVVIWAFRLTPSFTLELVLLAAAGFTSLFFDVGMRTLFLISTPDSHRGRVGASMTSLALLLGLVGMGAATIVATRIGVRTTMTIDALAFLVAGILALLLLPSEGKASSEMVE